MGHNTSVLRSCGSVGPALLKVSTSQPSPQRFVLLGDTLAALVDPHACYVLELASAPDAAVAASVTATARLRSKDPGATSAVELALEIDPRAADASSVTVKVSLRRLADPGVYTIDVRCGGELALSMAVSVEGAPATPPSALVDEPDPFPADGPQFRTQVSQWEALLPQLRSVVKSVAERGAKIAENLHACSREYAQAASALRDLDGLCSGLPLYMRRTTRALLSAVNQEASRATSLAHSTSDALSQPALSYAAALDSKTLSSRRKQYQDQAKDFYSYMGKNLSSADSTNLSRKIQFELHRFDYFSYLSDLLSGAAVRQLIDKWSKYTGMLQLAPNASTQLLMQQAAQYLANYKHYRSQVAAVRSRIGHSQNYSDLSGQLLSSSPSSHRAYKEGILWTHKGQGKSSGWHKQWVVLKDSKLSEYSDWKTDGKKLARTPLNLTFACVKRSDKKSNGFEVITTDGVTRSFRAESENDVERWLRELQLAIGLDVQSSNTTSSLLDTVCSLDPSNSKCCDCGATVQVEWISINILCVVCIKCSSVHRSLGSHISKVRSLKLDSFQSKEMQELLKFVSNKNVNSIYEAELPHRPINSESAIEERTKFITQKYSQRKFVVPLQENDPEAIRKRLNHNLIKSIHLNSIYLLQQCIAQGTTLNTAHLDHGETLFQYSLKHYRGTKDKPVFFITEFLLLNGLQVGKLPRDKTSLSDSEYSYWKSKAETNGIYVQKKIGRAATTKENKATNIARINTSTAESLPLRQPSSAIETNSSKRWSIAGTIPNASPVIASASSLLPKSRALKFPKMPSNKN